MSSRISLRRAASVADYRQLARRRLPNIFFEYIDGGSYAEHTLRRNVSDLEAISLRQRVMLHDMSALDMGVETFGQKLSMPVILAPAKFRARAPRLPRGCRSAYPRSASARWRRSRAPRRRRGFSCT